MRRGNELGGDEHNVESSNLLEAIEAFTFHVEFWELGIESKIAESHASSFCAGSISRQLIITEALESLCKKQQKLDNSKLDRILIIAQ